MELQPIHRRYGYGAARLPIGAPIGSVSLAEVARTPTRFERSVSFVPGLLCALLATLLATAPSFYESAETPPLAAVEPSTIDPQLWNIPPRIAAVPPARAAAAEPTLSPATPPVADTTPLLSEATAYLSHATEEPFDPRLLAMAPMMGVPAGATKVKATEGATRPRERLRPTSNTAPDLQSLEGIPRGAAPTRTFDIPIPDIDFEVAATSHTLEHRPSISANAASSNNSPEWSSQTERNAFLAALSEAASSGGTSGPDRGPRAHVAAAAASNEVAREIRDRFIREAAAEGWHEVPLDELPDCSPPGRQDELKKQILLAAAALPQRQCSHQAGEYRFLETRNLNAFLMWSRNNPDSSSGQRAARDVCDVLARAIQCLSEGSIKDL